MGLPAVLAMAWLGFGVGLQASGTTLFGQGTTASWAANMAVLGLALPVLALLPVRTLAGHPLSWRLWLGALALHVGLWSAVWGSIALWLAWASAHTPPGAVINVSMVMLWVVLGLWGTSMVLAPWSALLALSFDVIDARWRASSPPGGAA